MKAKVRVGLPIYRATAFCSITISNKYGFITRFRVGCDRSKKGKMKLAKMFTNDEGIVKESAKGLLLVG